MERDGALDAAVANALRDALDAEHETSPGPGVAAMSLGEPLAQAAPGQPDDVNLTGLAFGARPETDLDLLGLVSAPANGTGHVIPAAAGDVPAAERLGRTFARRDPVSGLDPLPLGRDSATFTAGATSGGLDPSQHLPELMAFRSSDRFPAHDQYGNTPITAEGGHPSLGDAPTWASRRAADGPAAAMWPAAPPTRRDATTRVPAGNWATAEAASVGRSPRQPDGQLATGTNLPPWLANAKTAPMWTLPVSSGGPTHETESPAAHRRSPSSAPSLVDVRHDFPILQQRINGYPLAWLDNGATTQKPRAVIDAVSRYYERDNSNVHRSAHTLAARATDAYEGARAKVARYLGGEPSEIIFVRGATEGINLVAQAWGRKHIAAGDQILVSHLEHHANIVPWQQLAQERGAVLRPIPVDDRGDIRLDAYQAMLTSRVKMVAVTQVSNVLGTVVPVGPMAAMARAYGARFLVDGAQSIAHLPVDVSCLGADFFVFSGHKVYGPTGIGAVWATREAMESMPPWQGGGSMIRDVTFERTLYAEPPAKFEAGTPSLADAVGLGAALDYVEYVGRPRIAAWEHGLIEHMTAGLRTVKGLRVLGEPLLRAGCVSFVIDGHEPGDIAHHLDRHGIAVRAGHHCAQPILRRFGLEESVRASVGLYNTAEEIDRLILALRTLR